LVEVPQWLKDKLAKYSELIGVKLSILGLLANEFLKQNQDSPYVKVAYAGFMVALVFAMYFEIREEKVQ